MIVLSIIVGWYPMPASYAHYRFGKALLSAGSAELTCAVLPFRPLFDSGLQGPDFFFYHRPLKHNDIRSLGTVFHKMTGREFFTGCIRTLKAEPNAAARAYVYGLLGHYALDAHCHPYVAEHSWAGRCDHMELEAEFDRELLEADGLLPPHRQDLGRLTGIHPRHAGLMAPFFPPAKPVHIRRSLRTFRGVHCAISSPLHRPIRGVMHMVHQDGIMIPAAPNRKLSELLPGMHEHYRQALIAYPRLFASLRDAIDKGTPLSDEFEKPFDIYQ